MQKQLGKRQYFKVVLILGALCTISPFSIDMYLPGFPAMARDLNAPISQIQLSLTAYLVGIALGQLAYGPLMDKYGRKKPLYAGLGIYVADNFYLDKSRDHRMAEIKALLGKAGALQGMEEIQVQNQLRGGFKLNTENGSIEVFFTLSPESDPKVQFLHLSFREE